MLTQPNTIFEKLQEDVMPTPLTLKLLAQDHIQLSDVVLYAVLPRLEHRQLVKLVQEGSVNSVGGKKGC